MNGFGTPGAGIIPVGLWPHNDAIQPYPYDLEKAKELLGQAGYPDGGLEVELATPPRSPNSSWRPPS